MCKANKLSFNMYLYSRQQNRVSECAFDGHRCSISRKSKCYVSTDTWTRCSTRPRVEAIVTTNVLGMRVLSLPHWNKELKLPSLLLVILDVRSVLAVVLANSQVPDSPTTKIKISKTRNLAHFAKICTHKNYQPYSTSFKIVQNSLENLVHYYTYRYMCTMYYSLVYSLV